MDNTSTAAEIAEEIGVRRRQVYAAAEKLGITFGKRSEGDHRRLVEALDPEAIEQNHINEPIKRHAARLIREAEWRLEELRKVLEL